MLGLANVSESWIVAEVREPVFGKDRALADKMLGIFSARFAKGTVFLLGFSLEEAVPHEAAVAGEGHADGSDVLAVQPEQGVAQVARWAGDCRF